VVDGLVCRAGTTAALIEALDFDMINYNNILCLAKDKEEEMRGCKGYHGGFLGGQQCCKALRVDGPLVCCSRGIIAGVLKGVVFAGSAKWG
jgi:hypothetical protein